MFEGKLTIDVSDRLGTLIAGLTGAIEGCKIPTGATTPVQEYETRGGFSQCAPEAGTAPAATPAPVAPVNPTPAGSPIVPGPGPTAPYPTGAPISNNAPTAAPTAPTAPAPTAPTVAPTAAPIAPAPGYTLAQISMAGAMLVQAQPAKRDELTALLQRYGTNAVANLKPEQLGAFATDLRGLGANI